MTPSPQNPFAAIAPNLAAPQHGPRPLPLFLEMLRGETAAFPERRARVLAGLKAYQDAPRPPRREPMPVVAKAGRACLRDYGGAGRPVVFVPSLINPPFILDLAEGNSLLRWLATRGVRPLLVDWGEPVPLHAKRGEGNHAKHGGGGVGASAPLASLAPLHRRSGGPPPQPSAREELNIAGHVERLLLPLLDSLGEPVLLAGYCLGGTMATAAAALRPVAGLALIAAPWHFTGFGDEARADLARLWAQARPAAEALGLLPMEVLQASFWRLDPARTIAKYEEFAALDPASERARGFIAIEDWANGGAPLTLGAGRELFEGFVRDDLPGRGGWRVGGRPIDPAALACPTLDIVSATDRIVPAASATGLSNQLTLSSGHVGMIVGGRARAQLWEPLARWLLESADS